MSDCWTYDVMVPVCASSRDVINSFSHGNAACLRGTGIASPAGMFATSWQWHSLAFLASAGCGLAGCSTGKEPSSGTLSNDPNRSSDEATLRDATSETVDSAAPDYGDCVLDRSFRSGPRQATPWDTPCADQSCAEDTVSASVLALVEDELERAGVGERYSFIRAGLVGTDGVELGFVVTVGWFQAASVVLLPRDLDASSIQEQVQEHFCLDLPESIASFEATLAAVLSCDREIEFTPCANGFNGCTLLAVGSTNAPWIETAPGCFRSDYTYTTVMVETGARVSCSLSTEACQ